MSYRTWTLTPWTLRLSLLPKNPTCTTGNLESSIWGCDCWLRAKQGYWFVPGLYLVFSKTSYFMPGFMLQCPWKTPSHTLKLLFRNSQSVQVCTKYYGSILKILLQVGCKALIQSNKMWCLEFRKYLCLVSQLSTCLTFWLGSWLFPAYFVPADMAEDNRKKNIILKCSLRDSEINPWCLWLDFGQDTLILRDAFY